MPPLYRSPDGGRTWATAGRMNVEWKLAGMVSDQGINFLRLKDGRLAAVLPRHVQGLHGGGVPAITFSRDDGATWSAPIVINASGSEQLDLQNIYASPCFTPEGMVVVWSTHGADPKGSFAGQYDAGIGGGKRAIIAF